MARMVDGTRVYSIEETRKWISPESGDVEMSSDDLPVDLVAASYETANFGVVRGLIKGETHELIVNPWSRAVCFRRGRLVTVLSGLGETNGVDHYFRIHAEYPSDDLTGWPETGIHARIVATNRHPLPGNSGTKVTAVMVGKRPEKNDDLFVDSCSVAVEDAERAVAFIFTSRFGLVLSTNNCVSNIRSNRYLIRSGQLAVAPQEVVALGLEPRVITLLGMDQMIGLQALITSGVLKNAGLVETLKQINTLLVKVIVG